MWHPQLHPLHPKPQNSAFARRDFFPLTSVLSLGEIVHTFAQYRSLKPTGYHTELVRDMAAPAASRKGIS
jgi:hypothetical protein